MRHSAMMVAGMVLSQALIATTPSSRWPRTTSSMESAMTSRLMRDAFMPSVPIAMPSETAMVLNSMGTPPAARTPCLTFSDRRRRWKLQGMTSIQVLATPIRGLRKSSSVRPVARSMARAGARSGPSTKVRLGPRTGAWVVIGHLGGRASLASAQGRSSVYRAARERQGRRWAWRIGVTRGSCP